MTASLASAPTAPLPYSRTETDERGNFHYDGDLRRDRESFEALCHRIERHLADLFIGTSFTLRRETFAGGRSITVELLDGPADMTDETARRAFEVLVRDQVERFGFTRSNFYQDFHSCSFYSHFRIGAAYWAALAARRGISNPVEPRLSLAAFKRRVKPGDSLKLIHSTRYGKYVGATREIIAARSGDLILAGKSYLQYPRASAFACDGRFVWIGIGDADEPDAHLLYEWLPSPG